MARKIIILERQGMPSDTNYRVAFWLDVPVARQSMYANPAATSVVKGATVPELALITSGAVVEVVETVQQPNGAPLANVRNAIVARFNQLQAELNARNLWDRYGTYWDGTSWTAAGVA